VSNELADKDKASASSAGAEATRVKDVATQSESVSANANDSDDNSAANVNASDHILSDTNAEVTNLDSVDDLMDFTDGMLELADCDASEIFDNGRRLLWFT